MNNNRIIDEIKKIFLDRNIWIANVSNLLMVCVIIIPIILSGAPFYIYWSVAWIIWMIGKTQDWIKFKQ